MTSTIEQKSRKPEDTAFKQQRLRAWQPILTPRTVLPTLFIIGIIFAPLGGIFLYSSSKLFELAIDYTTCSEYNGTEFSVPESPNNVILSYGKTTMNADSPFYFKDSSSCKISFTLQEEIQGPIFVYYQLSNFYQNHRRYVKSVSYSQLSGEAVTASNLYSDCNPIISNTTTNKIVYPCGLIANSIFNDTIFGLKADGADIPLNEKGITWKSDSKKYNKTSYKVSQIAPPPNWIRRYPDGYNDDNVPNLAEDEHFQVWMRTAALPNFRKLYARIDQNLKAATYTIEIADFFNATDFEGSKLLVFSTISFLGGKNPYLGLAYLCLGSICVVLGLAFTARHLMYPRKLGDSSYLSWNQNRLPPSTSNRASLHPTSSADPTLAEN
ncbi:alkylphosphocholine resistance protein lem3 [Entomophthora muscae]|uniref:Alkylphosphocholine resistance protein lem3 n=2 Tax=Entomophthora muscae TaxID=34485 RepID=A0ACC2UH79_9FUNG|nr:alkylphosphocholine resistance protein lem3 [Entomophthora muscae]